MKLKKLLTLLGTVAAGLLVSQCSGKAAEAPAPCEEKLESEVKSCIEVVESNDLLMIYPYFSKADLVCGEMPSPSDTTVILVAAAAYTGELLDHFKHSNIAGDHVSSGKRYKGYKCKRNSGAFVWYDGRWKFCHEHYTAELDSAALQGGAAFAQELIIKDGEFVAIAGRKKKNIFRTLCEQAGRLCIIETGTAVTFDEFKSKLKQADVTNAIYLDMGSGWSHAWYRSGDSLTVMQPRTHSYCTNWITFYR